MAEKRKVWRVKDAAGSKEQVLFETSADQVTVSGFTSGNVAGALKELASGVANAGKVDDVQDTSGNSIVENKIAKLSKSAVGLGNVDNTSDANKTVKEAGKAINDSAGNKIVDTYATKTELAEGLAGKPNSVDYQDYEAFVSGVLQLNLAALKVNDNVLIVKLGVPDMWVRKVNTGKKHYTYTTDDAIIEALNSADGLDVGYYTFAPLEANKVDLSEYQKKTDNELNTDSKTIVGAINEVDETAIGAAAEASGNTVEISNIKDGTTTVGKAGTANKTRETLRFYTNKAGSEDNPSVFDAAFNGSTAAKVFGGNTIDIKTEGAGTNAVYLEVAEGSIGSDQLAPTNVDKGQYSAVNVDVDGRVTAGGQSIEWGGNGVSEPSTNLMVGGLFFELQS